MATFEKVVKSKLEIELQRIASSYGFSPRILSVDDVNPLLVTMEAVDGKTIFALHSDDAKKVPGWIWQRIVHILLVLYEREGIEYVDITSFNFMVVVSGSEPEVKIIDFGDAYYTKKMRGERPKNWALAKVLDGERIWNADFR